MRYLSCLLFLLFGSSFSTIAAQSFTTAGNIWHERIMYQEVPGPATIENHVFKIGTDTIINGIVYKNFLYDSKLFLAIREDEKGNVRVLDYEGNYYSDNPKKDFLFYKFDAKAGDTIAFWRKFPLANDSFKIIYVVTSIDTSFQFGKLRKRLWINMSNSGWAGDVWIEGIGSIQKPFYPFGYTNPYSSMRVICFNNIAEDNFACLLSSHEPSNFLALSARPNPASDYITFSAVQDQQVVLLTAVRLYDLTGRLVSTTAYNGSGQPEIRISVADIANGMYLAVCRAGEQVVQQRVVVWKE